MHVGEAVAVALGRQVALELRDEQPPVREDQDAERARCLDEACGGDRLPRRRRMAEAVAADRRRDPRRRTRLLVGSSSPSSLDRLVAPPRPPPARARRSPLPFAVLVLRAGAGWPRSARSASRRARRSGAGGARFRRRVVGGFSESTRSSPSRSPKRSSSATTVRSAGLDLGQRLVERRAAGRPGASASRRILAGVKEGLSGPFLRAERVGIQAIRRVRRECRIQYRF